MYSIIIIMYLCVHKYACLCVRACVCICETLCVYTLIPRFIGFIGMYCLMEDRPVNFIIASSTETSL